MLALIKRDVERIFSDDPGRLAHIKGVLATALFLARKHKVSLYRAALAALLHDITKPFSISRHRTLILFYYPEELLDIYTPPLYHAFSAAAFAEERYGIDDRAILNAIASHVVGRPRMSTLEKIIFISDYIEPNRPYEACREVREIAFKDLDRAVFQAMDNSIKLFETEDYVPDIAYRARDFYKLRGGSHE